MEKKDIILISDKLHDAIAEFIRKSPKFDGDNEIARQIGKLHGQLHSAIRDN